MLSLNSEELTPVSITTMAGGVSALAGEKLANKTTNAIITLFIMFRNPFGMLVDLMYDG